MTDGYAGRFVVEATFLILLAVGVGVADERPLVIVAVMAAGWLLVSLIELLAWRSSRPPSPVDPGAQPLEEVRGWDAAALVAPQAAEPTAEVELTTVLPADAPDAPRRRRLLRRRTRA
jgi:hypothetical protein